MKTLRNYLLILIPATFCAASVLFLCAVVGRNI